MSHDFAEDGSLTVEDDTYGTLEVWSSTTRIGIGIFTARGRDIDGAEHFGVDKTPTDALIDLMRNLEVFRTPDPAPTPGSSLVPPSAIGPQVILDDLSGRWGDIIGRHLNSKFYTAMAPKGTVIRINGELGDRDSMAGWVFEKLGDAAAPPGDPEALAWMTTGDSDDYTDITVQMAADRLGVTVLQRPETK